MKISEDLAQKVKELPLEPGVYFFKNSRGKIIYIGKASVLKNRVRQYFQKSRARDTKTDALIDEIRDIDFSVVETELDALFLEAELIRRYQPKYNILLRDDKSLSYVRIGFKDSHPTVSVIRSPLDDGAKYYGPYYSSRPIRQALRYLRKAFPFSTHIGNVPKRLCLQYHLGLCPGLEANMTSLSEYKKQLNKLAKYLKGERVQLMNSIEREMKLAAKKKDYEKAIKLRNQLNAMRALKNQTVFGDKESLDISKDLGLVELAEILGINTPSRIEGYDISHMQGTDNTASMVVFNKGLPDKASYRKFKMNLAGNDDFAHMQEVIGRRFSEKNLKAWSKPDLILIDGGKGQLASVINALQQAEIAVPVISLAKRLEVIVVSLTQSGVKLEQVNLKEKGIAYRLSGDYAEIYLDKSSHAIKLLQRIRDESHRFAINYHSYLKTTRQRSSLLDDVPTVGPATKKKLIKTFGSVSGVIQARQWELEKLVGKKKADILRQYLRQYKK
jgi:excinuclease ABC subunit C